MIFKVGGPAHGNWESGGGILRLRDRGRLGAFLPFLGQGGFFSDRLTDPLLFSGWPRPLKEQVGCPRKP